MGSEDLRHQNPVAALGNAGLEGALRAAGEITSFTNFFYVLITVLFILTFACQCQIAIIPVFMLSSMD